jgi:hypothetical protein
MSMRRFRFASTVPTAGLVCLRLSGSSSRREGVVQQWHPFERRGVIVEDGTGTTFTIPNTRAFETVLPTNLRNLVGAKVSFTVPGDGAGSTSPRKEGEYRDVGTDRVTIRRKSDDIHSSTFRRPPPKVDLLAAFRVQVPGDETNPAAQSPPTPAQPAPNKYDDADALPSDDRLPWQRKKTTKATSSTASAPQLAFDILIDMNTVPLPSEERQMEDEKRTYLRDGVVPATHLKDLRSTTLLNETQLTRLRQLSGFNATSTSDVSGKEGHIKGITDLPLVSTAVAAAAESATMAAQQKPKKQESTKKEVVVRREATAQTGTIVAWSSIHRTGLVLLGALEPNAPVPVVSSTQAKGTYVIRNVEAFQSAMPSSLSLVGRQVQFHGVHYSDVPQQMFAEDIVIGGTLDYTMSVSPEMQGNTKEALRAAAKREKYQALILESKELSLEDPDAWYQQNVPTTAVYGVLTRWSGGQGTVEIGSGKTYFVDSAAEFLQLVDSSSSHIRGAVVTFEVNPDTPRFARKINVLTLSSRSDTQASAAPLPLRQPLLKKADDGVRNSEGASTAGDAPQGAEWLHGFLVSWSPNEAQGIIQGDDGNRYLLRDAVDNVKDYKERAVHLITKGRRVSFVRMNESGYVACHVVVEEAEADEETVRKATLEAEQKEPLRNIDGNMDEAVASPLSTGYWMSKLEKVGFDVSEVKKRQESVIPPELLEGDDDPLLDTKAALSKDRWYNDKDKNKKLPGSEVRPGDIAQMSPTAMVNLAAKIRNPEKLEKMKDKYYNQLSEEMKEHAWKQAKEMAPRYGKRIREAREVGEEPTFHFY